MTPALILIASAASAGFPHEYLGRWGDGLAGCSPGAIHGGLIIERKTVVDGEFNGSVRSVRRKANGSIDTVERWDIPDDAPTDIVSNYRLSKDKKLLTVRVAGKNAQTQKLIRCKAVR